MASKESFGADSFAAKSFACGAFRGIGVVVVTVAPVVVAMGYYHPQVVQGSDEPLLVVQGEYGASS